MGLCRICLTSIGELSTAFANIFEGPEPIADKIQQLCGLEILNARGLPDIICCTCEERLKSALELKQLCLKSDEKLKQMIQQESILESVYERETDPEVPIISYKILYDQVIEHVPSDMETDYVVEVEANTFEEPPKLLQETISSEYIAPKTETVEHIIEAVSATLENNSCVDDSEIDILEKFKIPSLPKSEINRKVLVDSIENLKSTAAHHDMKNNNQRGNECNPLKQKLKVATEIQFTNAEEKLDKSFRCCGCEQVFANKSALLLHSKKSHESQKTSNQERPFECPVCYKRYTSAKGFQIHRKHSYELKQHQCASCGRRFHSRILMENHEMTHTSLKPFPCTSCPKTFRSRSNLLSHLKLHSEVPEQTKHMCKICNKGFSRKSYLKHHNSLRHSEETPFECTFCPTKFKAKANLRLHLRTHTQERPYSCELCDKSFMYPTDKKRHMLQHTGQKPFKCTECDKGFTRKTLLHKHQITHRSETVQLVSST